MIQSYVRNSNNKILIIQGGRESYRMRQRSVKLNGKKTDPLKFISYKEAMKTSNKKPLYGPFTLYTKSKL